MGEQGEYDMDQLVRRGHQSGALQEATGIGLLPLLYAASVLLCEERFQLRIGSRRVHQAECGLDEQPSRRRVSRASQPAMVLRLAGIPHPGDDAQVRRELLRILEPIYVDDDRSQICCGDISEVRYLFELLIDREHLLVSFDGFNDCLFRRIAAEAALVELASEMTESRIIFIHQGFAFPFGVEAPHPFATSQQKVGSYPPSDPPHIEQLLLGYPAQPSDPHVLGRADVAGPELVDVLLLY